MVRLVVGELAAREVRRLAFWRLAFGVRRSAFGGAVGGRRSNRRCFAFHLSPIENALQK